MSYLHGALNLRLLSDEESEQRTCASSSLWAMLVCVGLVLSTIYSLVARSAWGANNTPVTDVVTTAVSVTAGSVAG